MKNIKFNKLGKLLMITIRKWYDHDPFREGAIIAYNAIFAIPGLLVVVITFGGYFFGDDAVSGHLHQQLASVMGGDIAEQIQKMIIMSLKSKDSVMATIIGISTIIIGATAVFVELQKILNNIWQVKVSDTKSDLWMFIKTRLFSFGLIISIAFLLLISLVLSSFLSAIGSWVQQYWSDSFLVLFKVLNTIFSLAIITSLFALMFKILPDARIKWPSVWIGAFVTSFLFVIGKSALGLYFGKANPGSGYGAAGSIILILIWTSYSSMIVFFGAEFTKTYSDYYFGEIAPSENAVKEKKTS